MIRTGLIIVSYNSDDILARCLESVYAAAVIPDSCTVVENGTAGSAKMARKIFAAHGKISNGNLLHRPDNPGYAGAINAAIAATPRADAFWILNPDTEVACDALAAMSDRMAAGDYDIVGCRITDRHGIIQSDGGRWIPWLARAISINKGKSVDDAVEQSRVEGNLDFVSGASLLVRRRIIDRAGLMRDDYFLYAEEVEWCLRARSAGARLGFSPAAVVIHDQGSSTSYASSIRSRPMLPIFLDERNKLNVIWDRQPLLLPLAAVGSFAALLLRYARSLAWRQLGYAIKGWFSGVLRRRGKPAWLR
jgi:GT2 family glycosyltransferase